MLSIFSFYFIKVMLSICDWLFDYLSGEIQAPATAHLSKDFILIKCCNQQFHFKVDFWNFR